jgi:hypothetical protein
MRTSGVGLIAVGIVAFSAPAAEAQAVATVREIVRVVKSAPSGSQRLQDVKIGSTLSTGDRIRTGGRSAAGLRFTDQSILRVGEFSEVVVTDPNQRNIRVNRGHVFADYKRPGTITGGYAVAAVRGTHVEYFVDEENKRALVRCYKE